MVTWALEYHTLILFSQRNPYEIKVYTFFPGYLKAQLQYKIPQNPIGLASGIGADMFLRIQ